MQSWASSFWNVWITKVEICCGYFIFITIRGNLYKKVLCCKYVLLKTKQTVVISKWLCDYIIGHRFFSYSIKNERKLKPPAVSPGLSPIALFYLSPLFLSSYFQLRVTSAWKSFEKWKEPLVNSAEAGDRFFICHSSGLKQSDKKPQLK